MSPSLLSLHVVTIMIFWIKIVSVNKVVYSHSKKTNVVITFSSSCLFTLAGINVKERIAWILMKKYLASGNLRQLQSRRNFSMWQVARNNRYNAFVFVISDFFRKWNWYCKWYTDYIKLYSWYIKQEKPIY